MKKTYKIDVDCANCANKMEEAAKNTAGVKDASVNFMMLKMKVEFEEGQDPDSVVKKKSSRTARKLKMTARSTYKNNENALLRMRQGIFIKWVKEERT